MCLSSIIRLLLVDIMVHKEQVGKGWIVDYIGLLSLKMHRGYMKIVNNVKGQQDPLQEGMKCLNNPCYIVRYLIFGVLILLAVDYVSKWVEAIATRTNDSRVVMSFARSNIFCRSPPNQWTSRDL